jgi:hypothetical protein
VNGSLTRSVIRVRAVAGAPLYRLAARGSMRRKCVPQYSLGGGDISGADNQRRRFRQPAHRLATASYIAPRCYSACSCLRFGRELLRGNGVSTPTDLWITAAGMRAPRLRQRLDPAASRSSVPARRREPAQHVAPGQAQSGTADEAGGEDLPEFNPLPEAPLHQCRHIFQREPSWTGLTTPIFK